MLLLDSKTLSILFLSCQSRYHVCRSTVTGCVLYAVVYDDENNDSDCTVSYPSDNMAITTSALTSSMTLSAQPNGSLGL